ncbi:MAG: hypothetical protein NVSMB24_18100 [Mucilaginibacter sp.]
MIKIYPKRTFQIRSLKKLKSNILEVIDEVNKNIARLNQIDKSADEAEILHILKRFHRKIRNFHNEIDELSKHKL